ncbi:hypothetical protein DFH09DRAFT_1276638 [Mycena vulgaris]|nr:hypothetical protein DFH09DRAFT_1276638 [Mycena vulgaris]
MRGQGAGKYAKFLDLGWVERSFNPGGSRAGARASHPVISGEEGGVYRRVHEVKVEVTVQAQALKPGTSLVAGACVCLCLGLFLPSSTLAGAVNWERLNISQTIDTGRHDEPSSLEIPSGWAELTKLPNNVRSNGVLTPGANPTHLRAKCDKANNGPLCGQRGAFVPCEDASAFAPSRSASLKTAFPPPMAITLANAFHVGFQRDSTTNLELTGKIFHQEEVSNIFHYKIRPDGDGAGLPVALPLK